MPNFGKVVRNMRTIYKFFNRRFEKVGKGVFSVAKRVLPKNKKASRPLNGKVIKQIRPSKTLEGAKRTKKLIQKYLDTIEKAGINSLSSKIRIMFSKNNYSVLIIQPQIPKEMILSNYIHHCSKKEAINIVREIVSMTKKIELFNSKSQTKIGVDFKLENFGKTKQGIVLFDFYPPYLRNADATLSEKDVIRKKINPISRIKNKLLKSKAIFNTRSRIIDKMNMNSQRQRIINKIVKARPELEDVIDEILMQ